MQWTSPAETSDIKKAFLSKEFQSTGFQEQKDPTVFYFFILLLAPSLNSLLPTFPPKRGRGGTGREEYCTWPHKYQCDRRDSRSILVPEWNDSSQLGGFYTVELALQNQLKIHRFISQYTRCHSTKLPMYWRCCGWEEKMKRRRKIIVERELLKWNGMRSCLPFILHEHDETCLIPWQQEATRGSPIIIRSSLGIGIWNCLAGG